MQTNKELNRNGNKRGMNPKSRGNLLAGQKANNHAKKSLSITSVMRDKLNDPADERWLETEDKGKGLTWRDAIIKRMLIEATKGNAKICCEILDRIDGKVMQPIGGDEDKPLYLNIQVKDKETKQLIHEIINE